MEENVIIDYPEVFVISDETSLKVKRSKTFVPGSKFSIGEKVKNIEYLSGQHFGIISSEKGSKGIVAYEVKGERETIAWVDLFEKIITTSGSIMKNCLNIDQADYFISKNMGMFVCCKHVISMLEFNGMCVFVKLIRNSKGKDLKFEEIDLNEDIPLEGKIYLFFAK